jgi:hypothetical protein
MCKIQQYCCGFSFSSDISTRLGDFPNELLFSIFEYMDVVDLINFYDH